MATVLANWQALLLTISLVFIIESVAIAPATVSRKATNSSSKAAAEEAAVLARGAYMTNPIMVGTRSIRFPSDIDKFPLNSTKFPCGSVETNSRRVEFCSRPLMNLIEGDVEVWPNSTSDIAALCNVIGDSEKCVRNVARICMKGLHKTITSTLATAVHRIRKTECVVSKQEQLLGLSRCSQFNQQVVHSLMFNLSQHLDYADRSETLELKTNRICCLVNDMEYNILRDLSGPCPNNTRLIIHLYKLILQDVIGIVCQAKNINCPSLFKNFRPLKYQPQQIKHNGKTKNQNLIVTRILIIIFSLGD